MEINLIMIGFILFTGVIYGLSLGFSRWLYKYRMKASVKKLASEENVPFLLSQLQFTTLIKNNKEDYLPLLIPTFGLLAYMGLIFTKDSLIYTPIAMVYIGCLLASVLVLCFAGKRVYDAIDHGDWFPEKLQVSNFLTRSEVHFLLSTSAKTDLKQKYGHDLDCREVFAPDKLVSFLTQKKEILAYKEVNDSVSRENIKTAYLTLEQRKRNQKLKDEYLQSIRQFEPLLMDLIHSTSYSQSNGVKREVATTRSQFEEAVVESEQKLYALNNKSEIQRDTETLDGGLGEAIRDLKRVVQSERVSDASKKEASDLIQQIIEKKSDEENTRNEEWQERDALAVIQASRLHFGIENGKGA